MNQKTKQQSSIFEPDQSNEVAAKLKVIGVGGGGGNAINSMVAKGLDSIEYIAVNTDIQSLRLNKANTSIQVGKAKTKGLGAGARPNVGRDSVKENEKEIEQCIQDADMIFITAGMGGGTGTGGAPVVASIAKRLGILTVCVVTKPFDCEGRKRMEAAEEGIKELEEVSDTVIVIPNEQLIDMNNTNVTLIQAFDKANDVLYNATRGISDLILQPGLINLDFADVRTTMHSKGQAIMGTAEAKGDNRAQDAANAAIASPMLKDVKIKGATNVLVNISAGTNLSMMEANTVVTVIRESAGEGAEIIWGTVINEDMGETLRVTVIATGFANRIKGMIFGNSNTLKPNAAANGPRYTPSNHNGMPIMNGTTKINVPHNSFNTDNGTYPEGNQNFVNMTARNNIDAIRTKKRPINSYTPINGNQIIVDRNSSNVPAYKRGY